VQALLSLLRPIAIDAARKAAVVRGKTLASGGGAGLGGEGPAPVIPGLADEGLARSTESAAGKQESGPTGNKAGEDDYGDDGFEADNSADGGDVGMPGAARSLPRAPVLHAQEVASVRSLADDERWGTFGSSDGGFVSLRAVSAVAKRIISGDLLGPATARDMAEGSSGAGQGEGKQEDGPVDGQAADVTSAGMDGDEPGLQASGEAGISQSSEDALVIYLVVRGLCNVSGCPEGAEALL